MSQGCSVFTHCDPRGRCAGPPAPTQQSPLYQILCIRETVRVYHGTTQKEWQESCDEQLQSCLVILSESMTGDRPEGVPSSVVLPCQAPQHSKRHMHIRIPNFLHQTQKDSIYFTGQE